MKKIKYSDEETKYKCIEFSLFKKYIIRIGYFYYSPAQPVWLRTPRTSQIRFFNLAIAWESVPRLIF